MARKQVDFDPGPWTNLCPSSRLHADIAHQQAPQYAYLRP
jgi:hypothetical protein